MTVQTIQFSIYTKKYIHYIEKKFSIRTGEEMLSAMSFEIPGLTAVLKHDDHAMTW